MLKPFADYVRDMLRKQAQIVPSVRGLLDTITDTVARAVVLIVRSPDGYRVIDGDLEGHLIVSTALVSGCDGIKASSDDYSATITPWKMSGLLAKANPDNVGRIWVRPYESHDTTNSWPLDPGDEVFMSLVDSSLIYLFMEKQNDILHILRIR